MSSHYHGLRDWLLQRGTAIAMTLYLLMLLMLILTHQPVEHAVWKRLFQPEWMKAVTLLFLYSLFIHAWLGVRNVLSDYFKSAIMRLGMQAAILFVLLFYAVWSVKILWN
jgi:succinate dehydrogenase / fumarate reductase membrane anchor subunit